VPNDKGIFWLASYPKSGNTWFRVFLANLLNTSGQPIDLNHLNTGAIASARGWIDEVLGFESSNFSHDEIDALRPHAYAWHSAHHHGVGYHKIHDAYTYLDSMGAGIDGGNPIFPVEGCLGALYFIRNPLDVAISFANHSQCSIDQSIANLGNPSFAFCKGKSRQNNQLRQWLLSWSLHVKSWVNAKNIPVLVLRYEDMVSKPEETFTKATKFLQLSVSQDEILKAIDASKIETLQALEAAGGFSEKPAKVERFFRKGVVGDWKNTLTEAQMNQIIHDHADTMREHGYL
jgi:hypothetical protein